MATSTSAVDATNPDPDAAAAAPQGPAPAPPSGPTDMSTFLAELNRMPLFMTTLDETDGAGGTNADLDALRALAYEGTRADVAANFRAQGNDLARVRRWREARDFYDKALEALDGKAQQPVPEASSAADAGGDGEGGGLKARLEAPVGEREVDWLDAGDAEAGRVVDLEEEEARRTEIDEACAVNRALCNLELKNYGRATRDCARALKLNPKNVKAYYRSALALLALDKADAAVQAVQLGLSHDASNAALKEVLKRVQSRKTALEKAEQERQARQQAAALKVAALKEGLKRRKIAVTTSEQGQPDMEDAEVALDEPTNPDSELRTPLLVLYPTIGQSELIKEVRESETLGDVLAMVLPAPWDSADEFGSDKGEAVDCYVETGARGLRKIGKQVPWGRTLKDGGCVIRDGLCQTFVVPKTKRDEWLQEYKKRVGKA